MLNPRGRGETQARLVLLGALLPLTVCAAPAQVQEVPWAGTEPGRTTVVSAEDVNREIGGPTLVTVHAKDRPAREVLAEIAKQAAFPLHLHNDAQAKPDPTVTLNLERQPVWSAVRELLLAAKARLPVSFGGESGLRWRFSAAEIPKGPTSASGPFLLAAGGWESTREVRLNFDAAKRDESGEFVFWATGLADPKLRLFGSSGRLEIDSAEDETGQSLLKAQAARWEANFYEINRGFDFLTSCRLSLPLNAGRRLARLRGYFHVVDSPGLETWEIPDISKAEGVSKVVKRNGVDYLYTVSSLEVTARSCTMELTIKATGGQPYPFPIAASRRKGSVSRTYRGGTGAFDNAYHTVQVLDAQGKSWNPASHDTVAGADNVRLQHTFEQRDTGAGEPSKLLVEIPTALRVIKVPFEFKDLPLQ